MILAVVGSRTIDSYTLVKSLIEKVENIDRIVSGGAKGVDSLAQKYCKEKNIPCTIYYPDWDRFGKVAGIMRNTDIVKICDKLIAIWDGKSRGTLDSIVKAIKDNKLLFIYDTEIGDFCFNEDRQSNA